MIYRSTFASRRATPRRNAALAYDVFCNPRQRNQIIEIMRRYALKEMATKEELRETVFRQSTLTGACCGIYREIHFKKYRRLCTGCQLDNDTGRPLKDTAAAVTAGRQRGAFRNLKRLACRQWELP